MDLDTIRNICNDVIDLENKKYNLNINIYPVTFIEYFNNYLLKEKVSLVKKVSDLGIAFIPDIGGFNDHNNNIVIFIKNIIKSKKNKDTLLYILESCYHEVRHTLQDELEFPEYHKFIRNVERNLRTMKNESYYMIHHDRFSTEIDANIYGIENSIKYIKDNYPDIYFKNRKKYKRYEKKYYFDYYMYDSSEVVDLYLKTSKNPIYKFMGNKSYNELIVDNEFNSLDDKIKKIILSTDYVLKTADINYMDLNEKEFLNKLFKSSFDKYNSQLKILEKYREENLIKEKVYLKEKKRILKNINNKNEIYDYVMNNKNINIR